MYSRFITFCLVAAWASVSISAVPLANKDFFWYPTDSGTVVPAFLKGQPNSRISAIEDDVKFWHYQTDDSEIRQITPNCENCLSAFIKGAPTIVVAHGFGSSHEGMGRSIRAAFTNRSIEVNLILINWSKLAAQPWYETAANNVNPVGTYAAQMVNYLVDQGYTTLENTHFMGHSLGAHVINYISLNIASGKLNKVFALDPALPLFGYRNDSERVDPADGQFVHVIHTAAGTLWDNGLAFTEPRGHVDFYPNSGKNQPGCEGEAFGSCSHGRCYDYLIESIYNPNGFPACKCDSWEEFDSGNCVCNDQVNMGWDTPTTTRGLYYLRTNGESPFGLGQSS